MSVMPATGALVMLALFTTPSASLALRFSFASVPSVAGNGVGQFATTGALPGPPLHGLSGEAVLRGAGAVSVVKSALLLSVSVQPPLRRLADVVGVSTAVGAFSKKFAPP